MFQPTAIWACRKGEFPVWEEKHAVMFLIISIIPHIYTKSFFFFLIHFILTLISGAQPSWDDRNQLRTCNGNARSWLELVTEHLMKGCGWPREHRKIVRICAPHVIRRSGPRVKPLQPVSWGVLHRQSPFTSWVGSTLLSIYDHWPPCKYFDVAKKLSDAVSLFCE